MTKKWEAKMVVARVYSYVMVEADTREEAEAQFNEMTPEDFRDDEIYDERIWMSSLRPAETESGR